MDFEKHYTLFKLEDQSLINNKDIDDLLNRISGDGRILPAFKPDYLLKQNHYGDIEFSYFPNHQEPEKTPELANLVKYIKDKVAVCSEKIINDVCHDIKFIASWQLTYQKDSALSVHNHISNCTAVFYYDIPTYSGPEDGGRVGLVREGKQKTWLKDYNEKDIHYVPVEKGDLLITAGWLFHANEDQYIDGSRTCFIFDMLINPWDMSHAIIMKEIITGNKSSD